MTEIEQEIAEQMGQDDDEAQIEEEAAQEHDGSDGDDAELEAGQPAPRSQKEIEELQGKLEREADRHAKRVAEIMGDDFALLVPSPVDWTPGFIFDIPPMHPTPDQVAALHAILGQAAPAEYPFDPDREACDVCEGTGNLRTHSHVPAEVALPCRFCQGHGWVGEGNPKIEPFKLAPVQPLPAGAPVTPDTYQVKDSWGRPAGHPHFGIDPVAITA